MGGIKDLVKNQHEKPPVKDELENQAVKQVRKLEADKLKHQAVIRFTDKELAQLDKIGLVHNDKVDNKRLREFIISKLKWIFIIQ